MISWLTLELVEHFLLAWAYFYRPKTHSLLKIIPRAAMFGLALSLIVLITTLSVMNGFERDIRDKLLSRTPHLLAPGNHLVESQYLPALQPLLQKTECFYHTKMLLPDYNYLQVNVIFSDGVDEPTLSSALFKMIDKIAPMKLMFFTNKKVLWQPVPVLTTIEPVKVIDDQQLDIFLPVAEKERFKGLVMSPMQGFWFNEPFLVDQAQAILQKTYPKVYFVSWKETYKSLFEALHSEKRLIFVVLSLLITLIYVQLALTLLLIFKDKEKDMISLYFFMNGWNSVYKIFFYYGLLNITFGVVLGCIGGWVVAHSLPDVIIFFEKVFHCTVLPYDQYYSKHLPSEVRIDDIIFIAITTFILGVLACHFIVKSVSVKKIDQLLRQHQ
jgi:lipoprotein-releasing system permease protein